MENWPEELRTVSHDINGSLFVIRGQAEIGSYKAENSPELAQHFENIMRRCDDLTGTLQRLKLLRQEIEKAHAEKTTQSA